MQFEILYEFESALEGRGEGFKLFQDQVKYMENLYSKTG